MRIALSWMLALASCGGSPPPVDEPAAREDDPPSGTDDRSLGAAATYGDLLAGARALDDRRDQDSDAGCLVRRLASGWRLEADLAVAVRPLPAAPADLDERLRTDPGPLVLLSRWGAYGEARDGALAFSAVTMTLPPRREPAVVWIVTDEGVIVRSSGAALEAGAGPLDAAVAALPADVGALFVAAEAGVPLARLAEVLARVPASLHGRVGLAVVLAPGTRLPAPPPAPTPAESEARCPDGLPALGDDEPLGSLRPERIVSSLGPLRQSVEICVGATDGPGAAGGRVVIALRIGGDGRVAHACVVEDGPDDPALRACVVRATRGIAFPAPEPAGFVDVSLPLALAPAESQRQRPLCE